MLIIYDKDIRKQTFLEQGSILAQVIQDASVQPNKSYELGSIDCPRVTYDAQRWSQLANGSLIKWLFEHPQLPVGFSYDGTTAHWLKLPGTWPPTIDTITHLRGQKKSPQLRAARRVLDVFCGTGMAGKHAAQTGAIEEITFSDIQPDYLRNAAINMHGEPVRASYIQSDVLGSVVGQYDLIIASAVPATSVAPHVEREINPLYEGTASLERLLRDAPEHLAQGGRLIVSHSSAGDVEFENYAKAHGAKATVLEERDGLFRVEFLGDQRWVDYLVERGGLRRMPDGSYNHTMRVKELTY